MNFRYPSANGCFVYPIRHPLHRHMYSINLINVDWETECTENCHMSSAGIVPSSAGSFMLPTIPWTEASEIQSSEPSGLPLEGILNLAFS